MAASPLPEVATVTSNTSECGDHQHVPPFSYTDGNRAECIWVSKADWTLEATSQARHTAQYRHIYREEYNSQLAQGERGIQGRLAV